MNMEKHKEAMEEVYETINDALNDTKGLLKHQRRIASMASLGMQHLIEMYFHKQNIIKPGAHVKHEWFRMGERNLRLKLSSILASNASSAEKIAEIIPMAYRIESDRNEIMYGAPLEDDSKLREKIDTFLEIKNLIEKGDDDEKQTE